MIYKILKKCYNNCRSGYITMFSVLVLGAVGLIIVMSLVFFGLSSSLSSFTLEQSGQAKGLADACTESALQQIHDSTTYTGTGNITFGQGACTYTVTSQGGQNRIIDATGTVGQVIRKVKVNISNLNPSINVATWQEVVNL